jgi:protoheme IX farnesyltransferase
MLRTRHRPLCTGRLTRTYGAAFGLIVSICGISLLYPLTNGLTAALAAGNVLLYAIVYTPLKPISTINTLVGAVVGAVPPVLGWTAATGELAPGALVLGGILFVWQIPHFLALCWMSREDYARGGFKMLPIVDATGRLTSRLALLYAIMLIPLCLMVHLLRHAGLPFAILSLVLTVALLAVALRFARTRANADARRLFFATIIYLPILCLTLILDARNPEMERLYTAQRQSENQEFIDPGSQEGRRFNASLAAPTPAESPPAPRQP